MYNRKEQKTGKWHVNLFPAGESAVHKIVQFQTNQSAIPFTPTTTM